MEDLKKIQEFFSKPLKENIVARMYNTTDKTADLYKEDNPGLEFYLTGKKGQDYVRKYKDHISFPFSSHMNDGTPIPNYEENKEKLAAYLKQKGIPFKTTSAKPNRGVSRTTGEDFMYTTDTFKVPLSHVDIKDISLEENITDWPKEVSSRYNEYKFVLDKVMSDRAKYKVIDIETGKEEIGGRVYGTPSQLQAAADDLIKPQGGRQSSHFGSVNEDKKLTYNNFVQMVRDDMMAGASPDEYPSDERVRKDAKYLYNRYLQGASIDDLFEASLGSTKSQSLANAINSAMLQIDDSMSYTDFANAVASILIDEYGTHNFTPFMEVLHARLGMNESLNEADLNNATKEEYNALLDKEYELTKAYNKDKTDANWKKLSDIRKKGKKLEKELEDQGLLEASKTFGHSSDEKKKSIAQTLAETIKLGEGVIEEKLCPKGKAYIKRRKAAGEKSSAYLSGRAVKVCKGQMSGRKKRKSKKK